MEMLEYQEEDYLVFSYHRCGSIMEDALEGGAKFCLACGVWLDLDNKPELNEDIQYVPVPKDEILNVPHRRDA